MDFTEGTFAGLTYTVTDRKPEGGVELQVGRITDQPERLDRVEIELGAMAARFYPRHAMTDQPTRESVSLTLPTGNRKDLIKILAVLHNRGAVAEIAKESLVENTARMS